MLVKKAPDGNKRVVVVRDDHGQMFVIGSVYSESAVHALAERLRSQGWTVECASAPIFSRAEFLNWEPVHEAGSGQ